MEKGSFKDACVLDKVKDGCECGIPIDQWYHCQHLPVAMQDQQVQRDHC